jgi:hypothetical protein
MNIRKVLIGLTTLVVLAMGTTAAPSVYADKGSKDTGSKGGSKESSKDSSKDGSKGGSKDQGGSKDNSKGSKDGSK